MAPGLSRSDREWNTWLEQQSPFSGRQHHAYSDNKVDERFNLWLPGGNNGGGQVVSSSSSNLPVLVLVFCVFIFVCAILCLLLSIVRCCCRSSRGHNTERGPQSTIGLPSTSPSGCGQTSGYSTPYIHPYGSRRDLGPMGQSYRDSTPTIPSGPPPSRHSTVSRVSSTGSGLGSPPFEPPPSYSEAMASGHHGNDYQCYPKY